MTAFYLHTPVKIYEGRYYADIAAFMRIRENSFLPAEFAQIGGAGTDTRVGEVREDPVDAQAEEL